MSRDLADVLGRWRWPSFGLASVASGWLVDHTQVPTSWKLQLTGVLSVAVFALVVAGVFLSYGELSPGRCRARTNSGDRCSRPANLGGDLCWQHEDLHGVELVEGVVQAKRERI